MSSLHWVIVVVVVVAAVVVVVVVVVVIVVVIGSASSCHLNRNTPVVQMHAILLLKAFSLTYALEDPLHNPSMIPKSYPSVDL